MQNNEENQCQKPINHIIDEIGENPQDKSFLIKVLSISVGAALFCAALGFMVLSFWYAIKKFDL